MSYEGRRRFPTDGKKYKHPIQEAADAEARLRKDALPVFRWPPGHYGMIKIELAQKNMAARMKDPKAAQIIGKEYDAYQELIGSNPEDRGILLAALAAYFEDRHYEDQRSFHTTTWSDLKLFGKRLQKGDVVITFNYDSCVERVLLAEEKWSPQNGYGFDVEFNDALPESDITILHLHGATGWYESPVFYTDRTISLDPGFLSNLGLQTFDNSLPERSNEAEIIIHPTYIKTYEPSVESSHALVNIWRLAGESLRKATKTFIIGYSFPRLIQRRGAS